MLILIKSSFYDNLTADQNKKIRNVQGTNGLTLGISNRVSDGTEEWQAFQHHTIDLEYVENLATALAMIENNESLLLGFETSSIEQYRQGNSLTVSNKPNSQDVIEVNAAIQSQGCTVMRVESSLSGYTVVEDPPVEHSVKVEAIKQKEKESFAWLNAILSEGFDYAINSITYNIPCKEGDISNYAKTEQLYSMQQAPDATPTYIRAYDYSSNKYTTIDVTFGEFKTMLSAIAAHFQNMHGQRSANMDIINNITDLAGIRSYQFRIL